MAERCEKVSRKVLAKVFKRVILWKERKLF